MDFVAFGHVDLNDQTRHRAEQQFRGIWRQFLWHQFRKFSLTRGAHVNLDVCAAETNAEAVGDLIDLQNQRFATND